VFLIGLGKLFDVAFPINSEILVFLSSFGFNLILTIAMRRADNFIEFDPDPYLWNRGCSRSFCYCYAALQSSKVFVFENQIRLRTIFKRNLKNFRCRDFNFQFSQVRNLWTLPRSRI